MRKDGQINSSSYRKEDHPSVRTQSLPPLPHFLSHSPTSSAALHLSLTVAVLWRMGILRRGRLRSASTLSFLPYPACSFVNSKVQSTIPKISRIYLWGRRKRGRGTRAQQGGQFCQPGVRKTQLHFTPCSRKVGGEKRSLIETASTVCPSLLQFSWNFMRNELLPSRISKSPLIYMGGIFKPPNWLSKFPSACNFPEVHSEVLRWSVSLGERKLRAAAKGADSALSSRLSSRHFTQEPIKWDWQPTRPVTWRQSCWRRTVATDRI